MVKKRYLLTLSVLILFAFVFSVYQYVGTMRTEIASAANTKPNPGHSWSEMESDSDSI